MGRTSSTTSATTTTTTTRAAAQIIILRLAAQMSATAAILARVSSLLGCKVPSRRGLPAEPLRTNQATGRRLSRMAELGSSRWRRTIDRFISLADLRGRRPYGAPRATFLLRALRGGRRGPIVVEAQDFSSAPPRRAPRGGPLSSRRPKAEIVRQA